MLQKHMLICLFGIIMVPRVAEGTPTAVLIADHTVAYHDDGNIAT